MFATSGVIVLERLRHNRATSRETDCGRRHLSRREYAKRHGHFVKASGLRWLSLMMLVNIPWAQRVWALPFLTVLAPSERYDHKRGHRHKYLTDWARAFA